MESTVIFFAGLWTLRNYPSTDSDWSLEQKFESAKKAGFDGIGGRFLPEAIPLCEEYGLEYVLYIDADATNYEEQFRRAVDWNPKRINVQLCDHDTLPDEAGDAWLKMVELAEQLSLPIDLELHRDTATETPEKAEAIANFVFARSGSRVRWCLDYSHFAVLKHLAPPFAPRLLPEEDQLRLVRQMHLRPFNGHHAQIPATNGRGELTGDFRNYLEFAEALLNAWLCCAPKDAVLYICPENGPLAPGGYALEGFPDVWQDAIVVRNEVQRIWKRITEQVEGVT